MILRQRLALLLIATSLVAAGACGVATAQEEADRVRVFSKLPLGVWVHHAAGSGYGRAHLACISPGVDVPPGRAWTLKIPQTVHIEAAVAEVRRLGATAVSLHRWTTTADLKRWAGATCLSRIDVSRCSVLTDITPLADLPALRSVRLPYDLPWTAVSAFLAHAKNVCELSVGEQALEGLLREGPKSTRALMTLPRGLSDEQLRAIVRRYPELERLDLRICDTLRDFSCLAELSGLRSISLPPQADGRVVRHLRRSRKLLRRLDMHGRWADEDLSILAEFPVLEALSISGLPRHQVGKLPTLANVQHAELGATAVELLEKLPNLRTLRLGTLPDQSLKQLAHCPALESLELHAGVGVDLKRLEPLTRLKRLTLVGPLKKNQLQKVGKIRSLESLMVSSCEDLESLTFLATLRLQSLRLIHCWRVWDISALANMKSLRELWLSNYELGSRLEVGPAGWGSLNQLECLKIGGYEGMAGLAWLTPLHGLRVLDLSLGSGVSETGPLRSLRDLCELRLDGLSELESVSGIEKLKKLHAVSINSCSNLRDLGDLSDNSALKVLVLSGTAITKQMAEELAADREDLSIYLDRKRLR